MEQQNQARWSPMTVPLRRKTLTFVVRIWAEYLEADPSDWRGELEEVEKGSVSHFQNKEELQRAIDNFFARPAPPKPRARRSRVSVP